MKGHERSLSDWLQDIVLWGGHIEQYVAPLDLRQFSADMKTQLAVIKCLEVIGEASARISQLDSELQSRFSRLELAEAYRMRNRLIHGYFGIDVTTVWNAATKDAPKLVAAVKAVLDGEEA